MSDNVISLKTHVDKKDLEAFSQALMETVTKLQVENQLLKEKVLHLEELLKYVPNDGIIILGDNNNEK